ncbi:MAG: hypothetical protein AAF447_01420 [Myxococcota bacterium]
MPLTLRCPVLVPCFALALALASCTDASLFGREEPGVEADRVTLSGRICTRDAISEDLPLRLVIAADRSLGPLFGSFDPAGTRVEDLSAFLQLALRDDSTEAAVIGFASRTIKLAPAEGNFTQNVSELDAAIRSLALPQPCGALDSCRDFLSALRSSRSLVEGDVAEARAGARSLTQYSVVLIVAGEQEPLSPSCRGAEDPLGCQGEVEQAAVAEFVDFVEGSGALGVKVHVLHFAADPDPAVNDRLGQRLEQLAFVGGGSYRRLENVAGLNVTDLNVFQQRSPLRVKSLVAFNPNARVSPEGPLTDSDADGLADVRELELGTDPLLRDTDGDEVGDWVEVLANLDPLVAEAPSACRTLDDLGADRELDGLRDCEELVLGTNPNLADGDGDGLPDLAEVIGLTNFLAADGVEDEDGDGTSNAEEVRQHTDPTSADLEAQLSFGYRYEVEDEGVVTDLLALEVPELTGITFLDPSQGTTPGVGVLSYDALAGTLRWEDASDPGEPGEAVVVSEGGDFVLPSGSFFDALGEDGRFFRVRVDPVALPPRDIVTPVRVIFQTRQCVTYNVRNIKLMPTEATEFTLAGENRILLFFEEATEGRLTDPGPVRIAEVPVIFIPPSQRIPGSPRIQVRETEFVSPR